MTELSLNSIFDGLSPFTRKLNAFVISTSLLGTSVVCPAQVVKKTSASLSIYAIIEDYQTHLTKREKFEEDIEDIINLTDTINPFIDFLISRAEQISHTINISDLVRLKNKYEEYHHLMMKIKPLQHHKELVGKLNLVEQKIADFYQLLTAYKYKQELEHITQTRLYNGEQSVGYTFDSSHSFSDFKKHLLG